MCRETFLPLVPGGLQGIGLLPLGSYVDSGYLRCNRMGIGHSQFGRLIQCSYGDNEPVMDVLWIERKRSDTLTLNVLVMVTDPRKQQHQQRDEYHDDPGTLKKLRRSDHQGNQQRCQRTQPIDDHTALPSFLLPAKTPPVAHHTTLREGKRDEDPHSIQVDESGRIPFEHNEQQAGKESQEHDTYRKRQAIPPEGKLMRQEIITRQQ